MQTVSIPRVEGRTPAQEDAIHKTLVQEARIPYQGDFDSRFVPISQDDIRVAKELYDTIPMVRTSRRINDNGFRQGGMTLQIGSGRPKDYKTTDMFGNTMMEWALQLDADFDKFGFAIASNTEATTEIEELFSNIEDTFNTIKKMPILLDPSQLDVYYYRNILGEHNWIVRQRPSQFDFDEATGQSLLGPILSNILVFTTQNKDEAPSSDGHLHSKILSLREPFTFLKRKREFTLRADERRSAPWVITERVQSNKDPVMNGVIPSDMDCAEDRKDEKGITTADKWADRLVRNSNMFTPEQHSAISNYYVMQAMINGQASIEDDRVDLPPERKLARQVLAAAPSDMKEMEIQFEQKVLQLFGIPPAMIQPESSHGKMVSNENAQEIFRQHMRAKKHELLTPIRIMIRQIYQQQIRIKYLLKTGKRTGIDKQKFRMDTRITVALHGQPPEARLDEFYQQGIYTYDAYITSLSAIHGIPMEHFEKTPAISREDLLTGGKDTLERDRMKQDKQLKTAEMASKEKQAKAKAKAKPKPKAKS